jgi:hypothetical protein
MKRLTLLLVLICCTSILALAQNEKVSIRMTPQPNQTVHMKMVQEMDMDISFDGTSPAITLPGAMKMNSKSVWSTTQRVGAIDKDGNIETELTYDEVQSEVTMNGQPMTTNNPANKFLGKKVVVKVDTQGNFVDVKLPPDVGLSEAAFRQMFESIYANLPTLPIAVGEVAVAPLDFTLPIPLPGAAQLKMDGQAKLKLVSIDKDSAGRSARFENAVDGKMVSDVEMPGPGGGKIKMNLDFKMSGTGSMVKDIDKGVLRSSESTATLGGKVKMSADSTTPIPPMSLQGTMKMTVTTN